jgi:dCMP deaminase
VGAIIVEDYRIRAQGYNGTPEQHNNCYDGGCPRCADILIGGGEQLDRCICVHAEENALLSAAKYGIGVDRTDIYVTHEPCLDCTQQIIQTGIRRVIFWHPYRYNPKSDHEKNREALRANARLRYDQSNGAKGTAFDPWTPSDNDILGLREQSEHLLNRSAPTRLRN